MTFRRLLLRLLPILGVALAPQCPGAALAHDYQQGNIAIGHPWSRAAPAGITGAGFMTLRNTGTVPDRLLSATAGIARATEIHSHVHEGEVMRMRPVEGGIVLPAGAEVALAPGGYHIMMVGLRQAMTAGDRVPLTLVFERAGRITVELAVAGAGTRAPATAHAH